LVPLIWWLGAVQMPLMAYAGSVYLGISLLRIRTFLEHRAHDNHRGRSVIVTDRGPLSLLFLNNNYHAVHHSHPGVAWYELPRLYMSKKDHFLQRNDGYFFKNYAQVFRQYFLRVKDPVPHPLLPVRKFGDDV
jgi:fatty acid desaturase